MRVISSVVGAKGARRLELIVIYAALIAAFAMVIGITLVRAEDKSTLLRVGYQKSSTLITVLKTQGEFEKGLEKLGVRVQWSEFTSGLPLLEALNVGGIDLSADVADTVPVFAQAAGAKLVYVAQEAPSPTAQAIVVPANSPIKSVADLKGKKIAFAKAAGVHYLLIKTLERAGLKFSDIVPAYLAPADGRAAFERGSVDAWVVWDPFTGPPPVGRAASGQCAGAVGWGKYRAISALLPGVGSVFQGTPRCGCLCIQSTPGDRQMGEGQSHAGGGAVAPVWASIPRRSNRRIAAAAIRRA